MPLCFVFGFFWRALVALYLVWFDSSFSLPTDYTRRERADPRGLFDYEPFGNRPASRVGCLPRAECIQCTVDFYSCVRRDNMKQELEDRTWWILWDRPIYGSHNSEIHACLTSLLVLRSAVEHRPSDLIRDSSAVRRCGLYIHRTVVQGLVCVFFVIPLLWIYFKSQLFNQMALHPVSVATTVLHRATL